MAQRLAFTAEARSKLGKGGARQARREGKIPAIIYGDGKEASVTLDSHTVTLEYLKGGFYSKLVDITLDGKTQLVVPRAMQLHPVTDVIEHIDFQRVAKGAKVTVLVAMKFLNVEKSVGVKRGGILNVIRRDIEVICAPEAIPDFIEADVLNLNIGDSIHINDVKLPEGVKPSSERNFTIASIASSKGMQEEVAVVATAVEGAPADGAAPAEGAAAPAAGAAAPAAAGKAAAPAADAKKK